MAWLAPTANAHGRHGIGDGRRPSPSKARLLARGARRVNGTDGRSAATPRTRAHGHGTGRRARRPAAGCQPAAARCAAHCAAVYAAAAELYDRLAAREMAPTRARAPGRLSTRRGSPCAPPSAGQPRPRRDAAPEALSIIAQRGARTAATNGRSPASSGSSASCARSRVTLGVRREIGQRGARAVGSRAPRARTDRPARRAAQAPAARGPRRPAADAGRARADRR